MAKLAIASSPGAAAGGDTDLPAHVLDLVRHDHTRLDPGIDDMLAVLGRQGAREIWHKHGTFYEHLLGVWRILAAWRQPIEVCRLGLMHSVYSNSFVRMKLFDSAHDGERGALRNLIGDEAERLVHLFCEIRREQLLGIREVPADGVEIGWFRASGSVRLSRRDLGVFLVVTMADYAEQHFAWQDRLFAAPLPGSAALGPHSLWPGDDRPGLWMHLNARLGRLAAACGASPLPPVFDGCRAAIDHDDERSARDLYWSAIAGDQGDADRRDGALREAVARNPFVAEPHVLLAQSALNRGRFEDAAAETRTALDLLAQWATPWDKRLAWEAWVAWARVLRKAALERAWPDAAFGIISLGDVRRDA